MKLFRMAGLAAGLILVLVWTGCGDTYRPVATPIAPVGGSPQAQRLALVVYEATPSCAANARVTTCTCPDGATVASRTAPCGPGLTSQIDVSGDEDMADVQVGVLGPVSGTTQNYAVFASIGNFVANNDDDTVSEFGTFDPGVTPALISLPTESQPVAMADSAAASTLYVADLSGNSVAAVSEITNASATATPLAVGASPAALAANPTGTKVYVANRDDGTVSVITTVDNALNATTGGPIPVGPRPIYMVLNSQGSEVYVLNQGGTPPSISAIDTFQDKVICPGTPPCTTSLPLNSGSAPNYMIFDPYLLRLYVSDPVAKQVTVFDASQTSPVLPSLLKTIPVGVQPGALAALPDGSRVYVADMGAASSCQVQVITTANNTVSPYNCLTLTLGAPTWIAISGDGSKLYVTETAGTSIITTSNNQVIKTITAPANMTPVYVVSQ
jgi:YVTN family beta-propeller protein